VNWVDVIWRGWCCTRSGVTVTDVGVCQMMTIGLWWWWWRDVQLQCAVVILVSHALASLVLSECSLCNHSKNLRARA
jgi:hypothetical protein